MIYGQSLDLIRDFATARLEAGMELPDGLANFSAVLAPIYHQYALTYPHLIRVKGANKALINDVRIITIYSPTTELTYIYNGPLACVAALMVSVSDGYLQVNDLATEAQRRFLRIAGQLPYELVMVLVLKWLYAHYSCRPYISRASLQRLYERTHFQALSPAVLRWALFFESVPVA